MMRNWQMKKPWEERRKIHYNEKQRQNFSISNSSDFTQHKQMKRLQNLRLVALQQGRSNSLEHLLIALKQQLAESDYAFGSVALQSFNSDTDRRCSSLA